MPNIIFNVQILYAIFNGTVNEKLKTRYKQNGFRKEIVDAYAY